jgi:hypothetical protein
MVVSMTERYAHLGREQLHAVVGRIGYVKIARYNGGEASTEQAKSG